MDKEHEVTCHKHTKHIIQIKEHASSVGVHDFLRERGVIIGFSSMSQKSFSWEGGQQW